MMAWSFSIFILLSVLNALDATVNYTKIIKTTDGPLRGTLIEFNGKSLQQFLGIPYAKPPVRERRFRLPENLEERNETLTADTMPPECVQYNEYPYPWKDNEGVQSEDCLYMNIWTPGGVAGQYETFVWIHGGGFSLGSIRQDEYQGHVLAAEAQIIVVTFNYRLGAFGFFTTRTADAPRNVAIYDMVAVLKWIRRNIHHFGGSRYRITLAGQGSGAVAVGLLCVSPLATTYFQRVIMQSGSPAYLLAEFDQWDLAKSMHLARRTGCATAEKSIYTNPEDVVKCLRRVHPSIIAKSTYTIQNNTDYYFLPSYGDDILPKNARKELIAGKFERVPVFFGTTRNEGSIRLVARYPELFGIYGELKPKINRTYGKYLLHDMFRFNVDVDKIINFYFGETMAEDDYIRVLYQLTSAVADYHTVCPIQFFAEAYSKAGQDVYSYHFIHRPKTSDWAPWMEVVQYQEIPFVFGVPLRRELEYSVYQTEMSTYMMDTWRNFAAHGEPSPRDWWPKYKKDDKRFLALDIRLTSIKFEGIGPHAKNCDFWREEFGFNELQ